MEETSKRKHVTLDVWHQQISHSNWLGHRETGREGRTVPAAVGAAEGQKADQRTKTRKPRLYDQR